MTDYSQFEAGLKSGIQADPARIRKKDELIIPILRGARLFLWAGFIFFAAALVWAGIIIYRTETGSSYKYLIISAALLLVSFFCFRCFAGRNKMAGSRLREFYEEGLLAGGLIVNTEPLTLMALSSLAAYDGGPDRYGCYKLVMKKLEGAKGGLLYWMNIMNQSESGIFGRPAWTRWILRKIRRLYLKAQLGSRKRMNRKGNIIKSLRKQCLT